MDTNGTNELIIIIAPSGYGKTKMIDELVKSGYTRIKSQIEYKPLRIQELKSVYSWVGRIPRPENKDVPIWKNDVRDPYTYDLNKAEDRLAYGNARINEDYDLDKVDFEQVSDDDKDMYEFQESSIYKEMIDEANLYTNQDVYGTMRAYILPNGGGKIVLEVAKETLPQILTIAKDYGPTKLVYIDCPESITEGQLTHFREEPTEVIEARRIENHDLRTQMRDPESLTRKLISESTGIGSNIEFIFGVTNRKTHRDNGLQYNFCPDQSDTLEIQYHPEREGDQDALHVEYILDSFFRCLIPLTSQELEQPEKETPRMKLH